jgi:hypothetical protein
MHRRGTHIFSGDLVLGTRFYSAAQDLSHRISLHRRNRVLSLDESCAFLSVDLRFCLEEVGPASRMEFLPHVSVAIPQFLWNRSLGLGEDFRTPRGQSEKRQ